MFRIAKCVGVLVVLLGAGQAQGSVVLYTNQAAFQGQGQITQTSNFNDFGPGFSFPGDPFSRGGVTYNSGSNLIVGPATFYAPVQNMMFYNGWTPLTGTLSGQNNMFGFDAGVASFNFSNSLVNATIFTNQGSYSFNGLSLPIASTGLGFLGFVANGNGEYITGFSLSTQNGPGWAAGMTNVQLGNTPEPATIAVFGIMAAGALGLRRRLRAST